MGKTSLLKPIFLFAAGLISVAGYGQVDSINLERYAVKIVAYVDADTSFAGSGFVLQRDNKLFLVAPYRQITGRDPITGKRDHEAVGYVRIKNAQSRQVSTMDVTSFRSFFLDRAAGTKADFVFIPMDSSLHASDFPPLPTGLLDTADVEPPPVISKVIGYSADTNFVTNPTLRMCHGLSANGGYVVDFSPSAGMAGSLVCSRNPGTGVFKLAGLLSSACDVPPFGSNAGFAINAATIFHAFNSLPKQQ